VAITLRTACGVPAMIFMVAVDLHLHFAFAFAARPLLDACRKPGLSIVLTCLVVGTSKLNSLLPPNYMPCLSLSPHPSIWPCIRGTHLLH
jgi:hypothetical protein